MRSLIALAALPCLAFGACDSDSNASSATFNASASDSTVVNTLDEAGQKKLCEEVVAFGASAMSVNEVKKIGCYGLALAFSAGDTCEDTAKACMSAEPTAEASEEEPTSNCEEGEFEDCAATIAEIETCLNARIQASKALAAELSCSADEATLSALAEPAEAACAPVEAKCPNLADEGEAPAENDTANEGDASGN